MNQSIFLIKNDFFNNPENGLNHIKEILNKGLTSDRLVLIYDPTAEDFFSHVAEISQDEMEKTVLDYFAAHEESSKALPLKWYQLDENASFHLTFLGQLVFELNELNSEQFQIYLLGCLPLSDDKKDVCLFFSMSAYDIEDEFLLLNGKDHTDILKNSINNFNRYVKTTKQQLKETLKKQEQIIQE